MKNIYLIGFMGSGKSYTGKLMADFFNLPYLDLDQFIEESCHLPIPEIFNKYGEAGFRELESLYLRKTLDFKNTIISCGGGTPCFNENMSWIKQYGMSIYLKATPTLLYKRLNKQKAGRPLISKMSDSDLKNFIARKVEEREYYYNQADYVSLQLKNEDLPPELKDYISTCLQRYRS